MPDLPLVSILIPSYNAARWISQSVESALHQTWRNKEVIVVDDGSTDDTTQIVESFGARVTLLRLEHRGGNAVRNKLTELASGEWLQYLDSDDYLLPDKIASQLAAAAENSVRPDVIYSPVMIEDSMRAVPRYENKIDSADDEAGTFIQWGALNTNGLLLSKAAVVAAGSWNAELPCCQEHDLLLRLMLRGSRFLLHNRAETVYRAHSGDTTSRKDPLRVLRLRMQLTDSFAAHLESSGRLTRRHRRALFTSRMECARRAFHLDPTFAENLSRKARSDGRYWISASSALPAAYQALFWMAGFGRTERLAARARAWWGRHNERLTGAARTL